MHAVAGLSERELARVRGRLVEFSDEMFESMQRKEQRRWGECYLRGLMLDGKCQEDHAYASALLTAVAQHDHDLAVIVGGHYATVRGRRLDIAVTGEAYIDLDYRANGSPVIERAKRAWGPTEVARRALSVVMNGTALLADGQTITVPRATLCIHGDADNAVAVAQAVRSALALAEIDVVRLRQAIVETGPDLGAPGVTSRT
jgi:lactam utilization protein B